MIRDKCDECGGKLVDRQVDFGMFGVSLGKFPAEVCTKCGEEVFTEETSAKIDGAAKEKGLYGLAASTTVGKSGDSLDIRISKKVAEFVNLQKGQTVMVHPEGKNRIVITF
ncbi:YgiT-type zinc finger protein [Candidatus Woesearchaeota archaeon]|nr:YgiT-type zinc finger protein [Candidatus Woesearchaeota archaeon]